MDQRKTNGDDDIFNELKNFHAIAANNYIETLRQVYINLETIITTDARNLSDASRANLRRAQASIQKMKLLTDDINKYLELYDNGIKKVLIDPNVVLGKVKEKLQKKLEDANGSIEIKGLPNFWADPELFSRLMINLIDNCIKFRRPNTDPRINISSSLITELNTNTSAQQNTPYTIIMVKDNGHGFRDDAPNRIFDLFTQLDDGKHRGSGIGLAICKKIMEMHGGFISAESEPGNGTSIHCYFPS